MLTGFAGRVRHLGIAALLVFATAFAPVAFARGGHHSNWGVSIGFSGPGYSLGYSDCRHCGGGYFSGSVYGGGYYPGGYYGGSYSNGYYGGYYSGGYASYPSYYGSYYSPSYYGGYYSPGYYDDSWYGSYYRPSHVRRVYHRERPVVVRRVVRYNDYYDDDRGGRDSQDDGYYPGRDYGNRDSQYLQRASYYDRRD